MLVSIVAFLATGAVAGLFAGLLGIGGGMIIVPALILLLPAFGVEPNVLSQVAVGTSLASISVISIVSTHAHHRRGAVLWPVFTGLAPGLVAGAVGGALIADQLPSLTLQRIVGVAALAVAVKMLFEFKPPAQRTLPGTGGLLTAGGAIGSLSALVGIGGGSLTVPFLAWCNVVIQRAVATSAACGMPIAWAGAATFVVAGWQEPGRAAASVGYVHGPSWVGVVAGSLLFTPAGAGLAHRLPATALRQIFAVILAVVGLRMVWA